MLQNPELHQGGSVQDAFVAEFAMLWLNEEYMLAYWGRGSQYIPSAVFSIIDIWMLCQQRKSCYAIPSPR